MKDDSFGRWVWLFPVAQAVHGAEELAQGYEFHRWVQRGEVLPARILILHLFFLGVTAAAVFFARRSRGARWLLPALAVLVLLNTALHLYVAFDAHGNLSGLVSALALWVPLGVTTLVVAAFRLSRRQFFGGVAAGAVAQVPVSIMAIAAGSGGGGMG